MKRSITVSPRAVQDSEEVFAYYTLECKDPALARRFVEAVSDTLQGIEKAPHLGIRWFALNQRLTSLRWKRIRGFTKYLIFYRYEGNVVEVVRILHGARDLEQILT